MCTMKRKQPVLGEVILVEKTIIYIVVQEEVINNSRIILEWNWAFRNDANAMTRSGGVPCLVVELLGGEPATHIALVLPDGRLGRIGNHTCDYVVL